MDLVKKIFCIILSLFLTSCLGETNAENICNQKGGTPVFKEGHYSYCRLPGDSQPIGGINK